MSATFDLYDGVSQRIAAAGIADYPYQGATLQHGAAVQWKTMAEAPDRVVLVTVANQAQDHPVITLGRRLVQLKFRGTDQVDDVDELGDACFDVFHGLTDVMFGSVHVVQMLRESSLPSGVDENDRSMRADMYVLDIDDPTSPYRPI